MGKLNQAGIDLIKFYEGCERRAYPDPATGGAPWTIGWGHTGPEVKKGLVWTKAYCDAVFFEDLAKIENFLEDELAIPASLTDNQVSAMISFAYNCGTATLEYIIDDVGFVGFPKKIQKYIYAGPKGKKIVLEGLVIRRKKEAALFNTAPLNGDKINAKIGGAFSLSNRRYS